MNLRMSASETKCCVLVLDWKLNWMNATTASKKSTSTSDECQHLNILFCYFTLNYHQISEFEWKCDSNDDKDDDNDVDQFIKCVTMSRYKLWALNLLRTIEKEQGKKIEAASSPANGPDGSYISIIAKENRVQMLLLDENLQLQRSSSPNSINIIFIRIIKTGIFRQKIKTQNKKKSTHSNTARIC